MAKDHPFFVKSKASAYLYKMLCINSQNRDPYFNLAAEEYLLRQTDDEFFMLWQSIPVVVTGKHQNVLAEINYRFVKEHDIRIARRLTGGGTVFHDDGNLNFSFIRKGEQGKLVNFAAFIAPVISYLKDTGVSARQGSKHEILVNDRKISGNAEHVFKSRVLHHGTLLFGVNLSMLKESIMHRGGTYTGNAVQSNRGNVLNLSACLNPEISFSNFREGLFKSVRKMYGGKEYGFTSKQTDAVQLLAREKYSTRNWIFGWSPDYNFKSEWKSAKYALTIDLIAQSGKIEHCLIEGRNMPSGIPARLNSLLIGKPHSEEHIREAIREAGLQSLLISSEFEDLVFAFF